MIKKILGVFFILFSLFLGLALLIGLPENIKLFFALFSDTSGYTIGYFIGNIFVTIVFFIITIYSFKKGLKLLKKKPNQIETINEIGKN